MDESAMEELASYVSDLAYAADSAYLEALEIEFLEDRVVRCFAFIENLANQIESYLSEFENDKNAKFEFYFSPVDDDPWSLFGDK